MVSTYRLTAVALFVALCTPLTASAQDAKKKPDAPVADAATRTAQRFIRQHDTDKDGKLSRAEMPERLRGAFDRVDANRDGFIDLDEDAAFRRRRAKNRDARSRGPRLPAGVVAHRDLEYGTPGVVAQRLDIYTPEKHDDAPLPLIVWIHGGAWRAGSKSHCPALRFVSKGYVVASVEYRLTQVAKFPAQIHDCKAAIRWLRKNASKYHVDPARIGVWGSSAGGHLVALLGTSGDVKELEGTVGMDRGAPGVSSRVQAVCDFFGPTDFLQMDAHALPISSLIHDAPGSPESLLVGGPIQKHPDRVRKANPITYVTKDDPPIVIFHGDRDPLVPHHQSVIFEAALRKAGVDVTFHTVEGAGHGFRGRQDVDAKVEAFFATHLEAKAPVEPDQRKMK